MSDFKVVEDADKVGAWAIKYNGLVDEVIESVNTVDDGEKITITYNKIGGNTFTSIINKSNVVTGKTYQELLTLALDGDLITGKVYELAFKTIDNISNTNTVYTGVTETLLLTAINGYEFHSQVVSKTYPQDIIYLDFTNNGFDLPNGTRVGRSGYIYYRHDTWRNLKVRGYDFRNHILYRYPVDKTNYNQYNSGLTYNAGDYVWYNGQLFVYSKAVGASTPPTDSNSVCLIETNFYLTKTGTTNYGTTITTDILLYPNLTGVTSGYTFSASYSTNNSAIDTYKNIEIDSFYTYNGWRPLYNYTSSDYTHKPNIALWGTCTNSKFTNTVSDVTLSGGTGIDLYLDNCSNINLLSGSFSKINLENVSNSIFITSLSDLKIGYCNDLLLTSTSSRINISRSRFSYIGNNLDSTYNELYYSTILNGCSENNVNKFYYSKVFNASNNLILNNVVNSVIGGSYHDVSNSTYINIGTTGNTTTYGTNTNNIIKNSNNINLYGSYNNLDNCLNLGINNTTGATPYLFSDYSTYKSGCENISTFISTGQITNCSFGERCKNIRLLAWNVGLTNCSFAPRTQNINFGTPDFTSRAYSGINTSLAYDGMKVSPARANITITNIDINNKNFIGLSETNQLVGVTFSGTTPSYVSIESYQ